VADNVTFQTTAATPPSGTVVSTEEITSLNGSVVTAQQVQRVILAQRTADSTARDVVPGQTPTQASVAASATSVALLAANAARVGATVFNDSTATLYLKLGTTASTSSYTAQMPQNSYYETPFGYTGAIDGVWGSATGNARITELV
jgi:hypothetical protein